MHLLRLCFYFRAVALEMLCSGALSFEGLRTLLCQTLCIRGNIDWKLPVPGGKREMQFWGLHRVIILFICRRSLLVRDSTRFVKSQLCMDHSQKLFFPIQSTRNWTEITEGKAWQTHTGYQIWQSRWISDHWTCSPTSCNATQCKDHEKHFHDEQNKDWVPTNLSHLIYWHLVE